ncbi:MAG TPA: GIY-YIG nuclease family protein [Planctomycetota bacterium]|nr:GIY-YIG nuclease family protein [Planctomycetota bacterium]
MTLPTGWVAYLLRCGDGTLYAGMTNDLRARLAAHRGESAARGAKYTRGRGPFRVAWRQACESRSEALRVEWRLKKMTRAERLSLARSRAKIRLPPAGG